MTSEKKRPGLAARILSRRVTNTVRGALDNWLPPVVRESGVFAWGAKRWLGPNALPDFKARAFRMSDQEFSAAYAALGGTYTERSSDTTPGQADWILATLGDKPKRVLEIGPGNGSMTKRLRAAGHHVHVLDLQPFEGADDYTQATVETMQLPDKSVDVIVLAHVLEHVRSLTLVFLQLERVSRERVLIVTPKQRYYRWTFDYHLHFFYSVDQLASYIPKGSAQGCEIDGDLCLQWDV